MRTGQSFDEMMRAAFEFEDRGEIGWFIITVQKDGESTRIAVGCPTQAAELDAKLERAGYEFKVEYAAIPERDTEEKHRATRLVAEFFGN